MIVTNHLTKCLKGWTESEFFQDGSYLAELLLSKGYKVHGIIRRSSSFNTARIEHLYSNPVTHVGMLSVLFSRYYHTQVVLLSPYTTET